MKHNRNIHNADTLEKEIYRLKLEANKIETKLDDNFQRLHQNFSSVFTDTFFHKKKEEKNSFFDSFFKNEHFTNTVNKMGEHVSNKAAEKVESLIDKLFQKKG